MFFEEEKILKLSIKEYVFSKYEIMKGKNEIKILNNIKIMNKI